MKWKRLHNCWVTTVGEARYTVRVPFGVGGMSSLSEDPSLQPKALLCRPLCSAVTKQR